MTLPLWCLFIATLFVYLSKAPMNIITIRQESYDNNYPRIQHTRLKGIGHRAWAAHQNMIEAYPMFAAAIIVSYITDGNDVVENFCAITFLVSRVLFQAFYLLDKAFFRSFFWGVGYLAILGLFLTPLL